MNCDNCGKEGATRYEIDYETWYLCSVCAKNFSKSEPLAVRLIGAVFHAFAPKGDEDNDTKR